MDSASWVQVVSLGDDLTKHSEEVEKETRKGIRAVKSVVTDGLSWWPTEVYLHWRPCWTHHRELGYLSTHYHPTLDEGPGGLTFQHFFMAQGRAHSLGVNLFPLKLRVLAPTRLKQVACDHQAVCRVLAASDTLSFLALFLGLQLGTFWLKRFVSSFCSAVSTLLGHVPGPGEIIDLFTWG